MERGIISKETFVTEGSRRECTEVGEKRIVPYQRSLATLVTEAIVRAIPICEATCNKNLVRCSIRPIELLDVFT